MDLHFQMLAEARQAEITRDLRRRTLVATLRACRRRLLGIFPVGAPCPPAATAC
ncbi:MAG TPA: hypothetical protein VFV59_05075 [Candidatus Limnocylindria bacterium]|nr:hypothetical protein [Candidatus Limnocylindria bacterium]